MIAAVAETNTQLVEDLGAVRELLSSPRRWTKGAMATSIFGTPTHPTSLFARSWCMVGAIGKAIGAEEYARRTAARLALEDAADELHGRGVLNFNDRLDTTHADILELLDEAIRRASA